MKHIITTFNKSVRLKHLVFTWLYFFFPLQACKQKLCIHNSFVNQARLMIFFIGLSIILELIQKEPLTPETLKLGKNTLN
jgi:uncharacterized membrane protein YwzB